jgi:3-hydroxybutyryl-CoA dehydrogenase
MSTPALQHIAAVGAGRMGRGIAIAFAYAGHEVALIDIKPRALEATAKLETESLAEIGSSLRMLADLGMFDAGELPAIMARVRFVGLADAPAALEGVDVVFEGVPEVLDGKRDAFAFICEHVRADAIVASTTSTFLVTDLAAFVTHPERLLNAHWLNPAYIVPLVELSPHPGTSAEVVDAMKAMLERAGKVPVVCAAAPGFIVPRLQALIMNEAARMIEQGIATAEEIDKATRYGFGFRFASIGVVEFIDFGGNDILYYASRYLAQAIDPTRFAPPAIVEQYMEEGRIGLKTGKGFYDYTGVDPDAYRRDVLGRSLGMLRHLDLLRAPGAALRPKE